MRIRLNSAYDSFPKQFGESDKQVNFYVDYSVMLLDKEEDIEGDSIALLVEPRAIVPGAYTWIEENYEKFKYVFTFDSELLKLPNAKLLLYGQITAEFPDIPKPKAISMVASDKDFCEGHINRQKVARALMERIDTYGKFKGDDYCDDKDFLSGYKFNVAMENYSDGHYFTEKICNCFASKIVPIYWGCPNIGEYFNMDGIVYCNTPTEVIDAVDIILQDPEGEYNKRLEAIEDNYRRVQKYRSYPDLFLKTYGTLLEETCL